MSKLFIIGYNPPLFTPQTKVAAAHYRTWQFLQPLLDNGHIVCLCANHSISSQDQFTIPKDWESQIFHHSLNFHQLGWAHKLQLAHDEFMPDCILAINFDSCLYATKLRTNKPIWMDIYGDYLTIIQAARYRAQSNRGIPTSIEFVRRALKKGDVFSVCGSPQGHALVGELAMVGRLNWHTFGYPFYHVILPGSPPTTVKTTDHKDRSILEPHGIRVDHFVVLWCGGYNTWTDVETLFAGLEYAMARDRRVHFVSVGANTYQAHDNIYDRFLNMIKRSQYRQRFHMLGWRPWNEVGDYYVACDVGLNIDALHYETIYGTRTRLVEMIATGLPVITSAGSDLSYLLQVRGVAMTFDVGDWAGLGAKILKLASSPSRSIEMAEKALSLAHNELSFAATTRPVCRWVREPKLAPDKVVTGFREQIKRLEYRSRAAVRQIIWHIAGLAD